MLIIQKDMVDLKEKASVERNRAKQEARATKLENERDWFRTEALNLDKVCKAQKEELDRLRQQCGGQIEELKSTHQQLIQMKKAQQVLTYENEQLRL